MGLARGINIDPSEIVSLHVNGHYIFVEDNDALQAMSIDARNLDAFRSFVTQLADALVTLTAAADAASLSVEDAARYDDALNWTKTA